MRVRIHRGAAEIGGNCVELEADGARLLLDLGRPLDAARGEVVPLPAVEGLDAGSDSLLGIVLSHPHQDHWGLIPDASPNVPVYMGEVAERVLREASFFGSARFDVAVAGHLRDGVPLEIGPFRVTPLLTDHSACDAYCLLVEAGGQRLFYTGDLRGHGRHHGRFRALLADPPGDIDLLLTEGTHVRPEGDSKARPPGPTERDVQDSLAETLRRAQGPVLTAFSAQNIDRLCGVYEACLSSDRTLIVDLYAASIAVASGEPDAPRPGSPNYRIWIPQRQRVRIKRAGAFHRTRGLRGARVYPERLGALAATGVFLLRDGLVQELDAAGCLADGTVVWSLWPGYLEHDSTSRVRAAIDRYGLPLRVHHASGHASVRDLQALAASLRPRQVVPIHTFGAATFPSLFPNVSIHPDHQWWEVAA